MADKYKIQYLRDRQVNNYSESIPLRSNNTNTHHFNRNNHHDIQQQKQRIVSYDDKVNQIVKKYEPVINQTNLKPNAQNQKVYLQPDRKKYQHFEDNNQNQTPKTFYGERSTLKKPKSQLQSNRSIIQAMKNQLHSKLNDLYKQTANHSVIYREQIPPKLPQNSNKRRNNELSTDINLATSSNIFAKQQQGGAAYYKLYDKSDNKVDKSQYITFKNNQMSIQDSGKQSDKPNRKQRNNKMIEQQISKLDKRIKQIQQNKAKSYSLIKKKSCAKIQNQIVNIKIYQSILQNNRNRRGGQLDVHRRGGQVDIHRRNGQADMHRRNGQADMHRRQADMNRRQSDMHRRVSQVDVHRKAGQLVDKNSSPLNENWKQYNNRYKHYISIMKPFEMTSSSMLGNQPDKEKICQINNKSRENVYCRQNDEQMRMNVVGQQQYRLYKRRTIQYKLKNMQCNNNRGDRLDIDKIR